MNDQGLVPAGPPALPDAWPTDPEQQTLLGVARYLGAALALAERYGNPHLCTAIRVALNEVARDPDERRRQRRR